MRYDDAGNVLGAVRYDDNGAVIAQAQAPAKPEGFWSRFGEGINPLPGIVQTVEGLVQHPLDTMASSALHAVSPINPEGVAPLLRDVQGMAKPGARVENALSAVQHLGGLLPFGVGAAINSAGDRLRDTSHPISEELPGAMGTVAANVANTALMGVAPNAVEALPSRAKTGAALVKGGDVMQAVPAHLTMLGGGIKGAGALTSKLGNLIRGVLPEEPVAPTAAEARAAAKAQEAADSLRRQAQVREGITTSGDTATGPQGAAPSKLDALVREVQQPATVSVTDAPDASLNRIGAFSAPPSGAQGPSMADAATPAAKLAEMVQAAPDSPAIRATKSRADQVMPGMTAGDLQVLAEALKNGASHEDAAAAVNAARAERSKMYATNAGLDKGANIAEMNDTTPPQKTLAQSQRDAAVVPIAEALQRSLQAQAAAAALKAKVTPVASHPQPTPFRGFGSPEMLDMLKKKGR